MMYAKNSAKNVISHIRQWVIFCIHFNKPIMPASVSVFMELMARSSEYGHIKSVMGSIHFLHKSLDMTFPSESFQIDSTLKGLKRRLAKTPFQVLPITPEILKRMFHFVDTRNPEHLAIWCSFLVSFFCLFRKASVVPESSPIDTKKTLTRGSFLLDEKSRTILVYVNHSKVIQFGQRDLVIPMMSNSDPALDPWRFISKLFSLYPATSDSPAFTFGRGKCVTYYSFTSNLKKFLSMAGIDPSLYSGHSFRRGGATFLHQSGGNILELQAAGDWSRVCSTRYLFLSLEQRISTQRLMQSSIDYSSTNW